MYRPRRRPLAKEGKPYRFSLPRTHPAHQRFPNRHYIGCREARASYPQMARRARHQGHGRARSGIGQAKAISAGDAGRLLRSRPRRPAGRFLSGDGHGHHDQQTLQEQGQSLHHLQDGRVLREEVWHRQPARFDSDHFPTTAQKPETRHRRSWWAHSVLVRNF